MTQYAAASYPQVCDANDLATAILKDAYNIVLTDELLTDSAGQEVLDFNLPYGSPNRALLQNELMVLAGGSRFRIRSIFDGWDQGNAVPVTSVHCEALWYGLGAEDPRPVVASNLASALTQMLTGTSWGAGTVDAPAADHAYKETDFLNPLALLRTIPDSWPSLELEFDSINRKVNLRSHRGSSTPVALYAYGKNLTGNQRTVDTTSQYTRVYASGGEGVNPITGAQTPTTMKSVNGGKNYVDNYAWYDAVGLPHKTRSTVLSNDAITSPSDLLAWATTQLASLCIPQITYVVSQTIIDSSGVDPVLGDVVRVHDLTIGMDINARVVGRSINPTQPSRTTYTVGTIPIKPGNLNAKTANAVKSNYMSQPLAVPASVVLSQVHTVEANGASQEAVQVSWTPVVARTDATPGDPVSYQVVWSAAGGAAQTQIVSPVATSAMLSVVKPGVPVSVSVSAMDSDGIIGDPTTATLTVPVAAATPNAPSTPVPDVTTAPGVIIVPWDGKDSGGVAMPANLAAVEVHISTVTGFTPTSTTKVDELRGAGRLGISKVTYGTTYYVKLLPRNTDGVYGPASAQATAIPRQVGNVDIGPGAVDTVQIANLAVHNAQIADLAVTTAKVNDLAVGKLTSGVITTARIQLGGGKFTTAATDTGARVEIDSAGIRAYDSSGTQTFSMSSATGAVTATGPIISGGTVTGSTLQTGTGPGQRIVIDPTHIIYFYSGDAAEFSAGFLSNSIIGAGGSRQPSLLLQTPGFGHGYASLSMKASSADGLTPASGSLSLNGQFAINANTVIPTDIGGTGWDLLWGTPGGTAGVDLFTYPRGNVLEFWAQTGPANSAVAATEKVVYSGATVGSAKIVSNRLYRLRVRGKVAMSAVVANTQGFIRVRLNSISGIVLLEIPIQCSTTAVQFFDATIDFMGNAAIPSAQPIGTASAFAITNTGTASSSMTTQFDGSLTYHNVQLSVDDLGDAFF